MGLIADNAGIFRFNNTLVDAVLKQERGLTDDVERRLEQYLGNPAWGNDDGLYGFIDADGINFNNLSLIASYASSTNADSIWHDDTGNIWHFNSDSALRTIGSDSNSLVEALRFSPAYGSAAAPAYTFADNLDLGIYGTALSVGVSINNNTEFLVSSTLITGNEPLRIVTGSDNCIEVWDTDAGTTAAGATSPSYVRFMTAGGEEARGLVGMINDDMELRTQTGANGRIIFRPGASAASWLIEADGDFVTFGTGLNFTAGSTSSHQGKFSWWSNSGSTSVFDIYNDLEVTTSNMKLMNLSMGVNDNSPSNGDDFILFRKNVNTPIVIGQIDGNGSSTVRYLTTSDSTLKFNQRPPDEHLEETFQAFARSIRSYDMENLRPAGNTKTIVAHGVVAQEVYATEPYLKYMVKKGSDDGTDLWGFNYGDPAILAGIARKASDNEERIARLEDALNVR